MANLFIFIPKSAPYEDTGVDPAEVYEDGQIHRFDSTDSVELAAANRIIADGAGFDVSELVSALIQISWNNITGKPSTFTPSAHTHAAADIVSGILDTARIPGLDAAKLVSGVLDALRIPDLDADKIATGILDTGRIPDLDAAKIVSGVLDLAQIPDLPASKITEGEFEDERISESSVTRHQEALTVTLSQVSDAGDMAGKDTVATADIDANAVTEDKLSASVAEKLNRSAKNNFSATADPDADNDSTEGYSEGSRWLNTTTDESYVCVDPAEGAAIWLNTSLTADDLGSLAFQEASNVTITGGTISVTSATIGGVTISGGNVDGRDVSADGSKLDGIESGATADQTGAEIKAAYEGEADTNAFTDDEKSKLAAIEAEATKNATDAQLRDRSTHTGTQAISTVAGLQDALDDKVELADLPFASIAEYTSTDTSTDLADASGAVIQWDTARQTDSAVIIGGTNDTEISFGENGKYRIAVRLAYEDTSAEDTDVNNSVGLFFKLNGTGTGGQGIGSTVINTAGANEGQVWFEQVISISDYENQVVTVCTQRLSGADELYLRSGESTLIVEKVGGKSALLAAQSISDIDGLQDELDTKADADTVYTQAQVDALLADKLDADAGPLTYQGAWNASTNTPTIPAADPANKGHVYVVSVAGSSDIDGETDWKVKDWIVSNGTAWSKVDNTEPDVDAAIDARIGTEEGDLAALGEGGKFSASLLPDGFGGGLQGEHVTGSGNLTADTSTTVDAQGALAVRALPSLSAGDGFIVHAYNGFVEIDLGSGVTASGFDQGGNPLIKPNETVFLQAISSTHLVRMFQLGSFGSVGLLEIEAVASVGDVDTVLAGYVQTVDVAAASSVTLTDAPLSGYLQSVDIAAVAAFGDVTVLQAGYRQSAEISAVAEIPEAEAVLAGYRQAAAVSAVAEAGATQKANYRQSVSVTAVSTIIMGEPLWPEVGAFLSAKTGTYSDAKIGVLNAYISNLKSGLTNGTNTWGGHDVLSLLFLDNATDALRWINDPATLMTAVNSPTHTPGEGYTGNGSSSYINSNFNPSTDGVQYTQNSASMGVWVRAVGSSGLGYYAGLAVGPDTTAIARSTDGNAWVAFGPSGGPNNNETTLSQSASGLLGINRSGAAAIECYVAGVLDGTDTDSSSAPANADIYILARNDSGTPFAHSDGQASIFRAGRSFTAAEWADIHAADNALLTAWAAA
jgi:hypothetical protein